VPSHRKKCDIAVADLRQEAELKPTFTSQTVEKGKDSTCAIFKIEMARFIDHSEKLFVSIVKLINNCT
jgi:hypothetical protein